MSTWRFKSLGVQIPAIATLLSAILAGAIATLAVVTATGTLRSGAEKQLSAIVDERASQLNDYATRISSDLHILVEDTAFQRALRTFDRLVGEDAGPGSAVALAREQFDARFRNIVTEKHYSDLFLISEKGTVAYSVSHTLEGKTIKQGGDLPLLVKAVGDALAAKDPGIVTFADFNGTTPRSKAYLIQALPDVNGGWLGTLAIEIELKALSASFNAPFGSTGLLSVATESGQARSVQRENVSIPSGDKLTSSRSIQFLGQKWQMAGSQTVEEIDAPAKTMQFAVIGLSVLLILLSTLVLNMFMRRRMSIPLSQMSDAMHRLADHDLTVEIPSLDRQDEIGDMAHSVVVFKQAAIENRQLQEQAEEIRRIAEEERLSAAAAAIEAERAQVITMLGRSLSQVAKGDLSDRIRGAIPDAYKQLQSDFNEAVGELDRAVSDVAQAANAIDNAILQIKSGSDELSRHIETNAASLEETSAALSDISHTVQDSASQAARANKLVAETRSRAQQGGAVIGQAMDAMRAIEKSSQEIGQIMSVMDEIAFQTNLLALNAGVEAARAGESGRGFAVVAAEVRGLAQRSAEAAKQVRDLIRTSATTVANGVQLVSATRDNLSEIITNVDAASSTCDTIAASAKDQAAALVEINSAVSRMSQTTQHSAAMVEEATAAIAALAEEANHLEQSAARFQCSQTGSSSYSTRHAA